MQSPHEPLILDLLAWLAEGEKPYPVVMDAWRTSCPRLPVWEDAVDRVWVSQRDGMVAVTEAGLAALKRRSATSDQIASMTPNGQVPARNP